MRTHSLIATATLACCLAGIASPATGLAQHGSPPLVTKAPKEADQFAFLVGQWSLTVKPQAVGLAQKMHGVPKLHGTWKAWKALDGWGVEDELRIVDASGNPLAFTEFVRVYDAAAKHWNVTAVDAYHGKITTGTAEWTDGGMISMSDGVDESGKAYVSRVKITGITATSFTYTKDRSSDGGKTWEEGLLTIDAKRTGAAAAR